jgi:hypothetical protein
VDEDASQIRDILSALVERVELFFDHQQKGKRTFCTFACALVFFKDELFASTPSSSTSCRHVP